MQENKWLAMVLTALALTAGSPTQGENTMGFHAGYWIPKDGGDRIGGGIRVSLEMIEEIQVEVRTSYFDGFSQEGQGTTAEFRAFPIEVGLLVRHEKGDRLAFHGGGGMGYYLFEGQLRDADRKELGASPGDRIGFFLACGLTWGFGQNPRRSFGQSRPVLLAEILYRAVKAGGMRVVEADPLRTEQAELDGLGLNIGLLIGW